jgi:vancomycin aglycone glucosyltransferase
MRFLLSTYGSRGDVEPLVGLAAALKTLGAEAVVSAPGDDEFVDLAARADVEFAPAFMGVREWIASARRNPGDIQEYGRRMIGAQYAAIDAVADGCDAVVATGLMPSVGAAQCVAERRGLAYEHVTFCPLFLPSEHHRPFPYPGHPHPPGVTDAATLWAINAEAMNELFAGNINGQREAVGLPPVTNIRDHVFTRQSLLASDPVLWPWEPTTLSEPLQTGAWILPDERALPAELEAWLEAGTAPVYLGFGSIAVAHARESATAAIGAVRAHGRRMVLARGWADLAAMDDGDDCFVIGEINQQRLFPRMAAVIHHGGAGTTTTAARAGSPQVIVPQIVDQPFWAARVAGLGIGVAHEGSVPTLESLTAALDVALRPEMGTRAEAVAAAVRTDGAMVAARYLIGTVGASRGH